MALVTKNNPVGVDYWIQNLQSQMYSYLTTVWGLDDSQYCCYGRAYKIQEKDGFTPKVFVGKANGEEYVTSLLNDTIPALSFFYVGDTTRVNFQGQNEANLSVIFFVNLARVKPMSVYSDVYGSTYQVPTTQRNDEEVHLDAWTTLYERWGFRPNAIHTGQMVFKDFQSMRTKKQSDYRDMQPWHYFRIEGTLTYENIALPNCY